MSDHFGTSIAVLWAGALVVFVVLLWLIGGGNAEEE